MHPPTLFWLCLSLKALTASKQADGGVSVGRYGEEMQELQDSPFRLYASTFPQPKCSAMLTQRSSTHFLLSLRSLSSTDVEMARDAYCVPSIHMVVYNSLGCHSSSRGSGAIFWPLQAPGTPVMHLHKSRGNINTYKMKVNRSIKMSTLSIGTAKQ